MNLFESLRIAFDSLLTNRMRALLTTLGIIIGVASVVSLVNMGNGVQDYVNRQFSGLGADILTVTSKRPDSDTTDIIEPLTVAEGEDLANRSIAPHVTDVVMQYDVRVTLRYRGESYSLAANGVTANYNTVNDWNTQVGTFITQEDVEEANLVIVIGQTVVEELFGSATVNVIGLPLEVNDRVFTIIGVMEEESAQGFLDANAVAFIPLSTAQRRLDDARVRGGTYRLNQLQLKVTSGDDVDVAAREVASYLREAHDIAFVGEEDFEVSNPGETLDALNQITTTLTIFLGLIAGISLLVGGIGIMNIMLVSVSERTREIGLRKAVGAQQWDILGQFLIESIILSILGGVLGILVGWLIIALSQALVDDFYVSLSLSSVLLATGVSTFIGVFFGLYPASRAAALSPIDALRSE